MGRSVDMGQGPGKRRPTGIATMEQFEWSQTVLETESRMAEGTDD